VAALEAGGQRLEQALENSSYALKSIGRSLRLLQQFTPLSPEQSLAALSRSAGLPRSTTHRLLLSLVRGGLIEHSPQTSGVYRLGPEALRLGQVAQSQYLPRDAVFQMMRGLSVALDLTVGLTTLADHEVLVVERVEGSGPFRRAYGVGARIPAQATASGRVLLAALTHEELDEFFAPSHMRAQIPTAELRALRCELERVRYAGVALDQGSYIAGLACAAVPVRMSIGGRHFALAISGPLERIGHCLEKRNGLAALQDLARTLGRSYELPRLVPQGC